MKHVLTDQERKHLDQRTADVEKRTGAQIVLAIVKRSDSYAELPWKAFALGAGVAGAGTVLFDVLRSGWDSRFAALFTVTATLGAGAVCALLCIGVPRFARIFLDAHRAETEVRQYAQSLFLSREVFATRERTGILLLVSMFERQVIVLPDSGLDKRLGREALQGIAARMTTALAAGQAARALEKGLQVLEEYLAATAFAASGADELPNAIVEEKGA